MTSINWPSLKSFVKSSKICFETVEVYAQTVGACENQAEGGVDK